MSKKEQRINSALIDELIKDCKSPEDILGQSGLLQQLKKAVLERALDSELTTHLGYDKHAITCKNTGNSRNGHSSKTITCDDGEIELSIPRDRNGDYTPQLIPKNQTRFNGFDDKIIAMYARGMSTRDIQGHLEELYNVDVSATLISNVTNSVLDEVKSWQSRGLDKVYPIVYLDCLVIKVREDKRIVNKAFYLALGVNIEGQKELLGIWVSQNEGAKFWLTVLTELKNRGLDDIFIACVDGLTGFPEAIETVYPLAQVQLCIVHMIRNSVKFVGWKERKAVCSDLKSIYKATTLDDAELALTAFGERWDGQYPSIRKIWLNHWERITPFFDYPPEIRKIIYTTNAIESLNMSLRKVIKNKRVFPSDSAAIKLLYLALNNISKKWTMPIQNWGPALNHFMIMFEERLPNGLI